MPKTPVGELKMLPEIPLLVGRTLAAPPQEPHTHYQPSGLNLRPQVATTTTTTTV